MVYILADYYGKNLEIHGKENHLWKLNSPLLMINGSLKNFVKKFIDSNENENTTYLNQWDTVAVILRGKFITTRPTSEN
jgi:hypothetical protein